MLLGLHPSSRAPLRSDALSLHGQGLPLGSAKAVEEAEKSRTKAASPLRRHSVGFEPWPGILVVMARLAALHERIRAKEVRAHQGFLPAAACPN